MEIHSRDNRTELVHPGRMRDRLAGVLGVTGKAEGLGAVEGDRVADFARLVAVRTDERSLFGGLSLCVLGRRWTHT